MHIIIAGSGKSARSNTEALLEDYIAANPNVTLVLPAFRSEFNAPQTHASQLFEDKELPTILITRKDVDYDFIPAHTERVEIGANDDILEASMKYLKGQSEGLFIVWNDEDPLSLALLKSSQTYGVKAFDLTEGLVTLVPPTNLEVEPEPNIPIEEQIIDEFDGDEDDDEDEDEIIENIGLVLSQESIDLLAKAIAAELRKVIP